MTRARTIAILVLLAAFCGAPALAAKGMKAKLEKDARFVLTGVEFQGMTATLTGGSRLALVPLVPILKQHPETRLVIEAFVDPTDPNAQALSDQRAAAVVARLIQLGAPRATLEAKGLGGTEVLVPSIVAAMKAKNRRIQVRVVVPPGAVKVAATPARTPVVAVVTPRPTPRVVATPAPTPRVIATPAPTPEPPRPASAGTRVIVVSTRGTAAGAAPVVTATLRRAGAEVVRIAEVRETRPATTIYHLPELAAEASRLRAAAGLRSATLVSVKRIDPQTSLMIVLGSNERRR